MLATLKPKEINDNDYLETRKINELIQELQIITKILKILEAEKRTYKKELLSDLDESIRNIKESFPEKSYLEIKQLIENG
jgi:hypothetical protein